MLVEINKIKGDDIVGMMHREIRDLVTAVS